MESLWVDVGSRAQKKQSDASFVYSVQKMVQDHLHQRHSVNNNMAATTITLVACRMCFTPTPGRCPRCKCVAYCSGECFLKDHATHVQACPTGTVAPATLPGGLSAKNPLSDYQSARPIGWAKALDHCATAARDQFIVLHQASDDVTCMTWEELKGRLPPHPAAEHPMLQSLRTRTEPQRNFLLLLDDGTFYYTRAAIMRL